jgi:hypothetical protein
MVMKKILVVFLVLAVSTGVFAQGEWNINARAELGAAIDLNAENADGEKEATTQKNGYNFVYTKSPFTGYGGWGNYGGHVGIGYNYDNFHGSIGIDHLEGFGVEAAVWAENYGFLAASNAAQIFNDNTNQFSRLWGYYNMLDGMIELKVAYNGEQKDGSGAYWTSDRTGAFGGAFNYGGFDQTGIFDDGNTFTSMDHWNFLLGNLHIAGLEAGLLIGNIFGGKNGNLNADPVPLNEGAIKKSILGAKFNMDIFEAAAQLKFEDYGVYIGAKVDLYPITAGISFNGILSNDDYSKVKVGASVGYEGDGFGIGLRGMLENQRYKQDDADGNLSGDAMTRIGIEPAFYIKPMPEYLTFKLNAGFYFSTPSNAANGKGDMVTDWALQPALIYNFKGTGAPSGTWPTSGYDWSGWWTGMMFRYRIFSDVVNCFDMIFRFSM